MKSQYRQKFFELYTREILPAFLEYENKRKQKLKYFYSGTFACIVMLLYGIFLFTPLAFGGFQEYNAYLGIIIFIISIAGFVYLSFFNKNFKKELKKLCEPAFAKCFKNLEWDKSGTYDKYILESSNLFGYFNRESYDDIFTITHEGVKIEVIEAHFEDVQGSGKNRRTYNVFKGVIIIFPSNKIVKAQTIVTSKGDNLVRNTRSGVGISLLVTIILFIYFLLFNDIGNAVIYGIGILIALYAYRKFKPKPMENIKLEDVDFDKRFQVSSEDQVEARYLVTPAFMDRLKGLQTGFGTKKIKCSFFEDKIMFAMSTNEDLFEVGNLFVPLNNSKQMTKFFNELTSILEMVDHFKLDQKIGL